MPVRQAKTAERYMHTKLVANKRRAGPAPASWQTASDIVVSTSKKQKNVARILSPTVVIAGLWTNFALAISSKPFNVFHYKTARTLKEVLSTLGDFEEAAECLIRKLDRIEVIANADGIAEFATLAVRSVTTKGEGKGVKVSKLEQC
jgi:hypothetical protein